MNKAFTILFGAVLALGASASEMLLPGSINFDDPSLWDKKVGFGFDDYGRYSGIGRWYYENEESSNSRVMHLSGTSTGYLMVGTSGSLHRTIMVTKAEGPEVGSGYRLTGDGIYLDTKVVLSAYRKPELAAPSARDKLSCWAHATEEGTTNFVITAGYRQENGAVVVSNYVTTVTGVNFGNAHRLTIKAMLDSSGSNTVFEVYLDNEKVKSVDGFTQFPSMNCGIAGVAEGGTIYSLGFSGSGTADMVNFTKVNPFENPEYDQTDLGMLRQCADIKVTGYSQAFGSLLNFPMLVRVSEELIENFRYERTRPGGRDIRFTDASGNLLPCEVDLWNPNGESLIWVKVPYFIAGVNIRMHWDLKEGYTPPANDSTKVWEEYVAVWHMSEASSGSYAKDSSGHGYIATMSGGRFQMAPSSVIGTAGYAPKLGGSANNASLNSANYVEDLGEEQLFTFTGWYLAKDISEFPTIPFVGMKWKANANISMDDSVGWAANLTSATTVKMNGSGSTGEERAAGDSLSEEWFHLAFVKEAENKALMYFDGRLFGSLATKQIETNRNFQVMLNGFCGDEIRIAKVARNEDWILAEYSMATNRSFLEYGPASAKGTHNFWLEEPWVSSQSVAPSEVGSLVINPGRPRYGETVVYFYDNNDNRIERIPAELGSYRVEFLAIDARREPLHKSFYIIVCEDRGYFNVGGTDRVMLFNSDDAEGFEVGFQGYWDVDSLTNAVWYHSADLWSAPITGSGSGSFVEAGDHHIYYEPGTHRKLWEFRHARIGNLYPREDTLLERMNFLPWSSTSARFDDSATPVGRRRYVGNLILQNVSDNSGVVDPETGLPDPAGVYSPLYTNGIGTVYFDTVNAYGGYDNKLRLEVQREGNTEWQVMPVDVFAIVDGVYNEELSSNRVETIVLNMDKPEGTENWFYRVRAELDITAPVRFRIIRVDSYELNGWGTGGTDGEGLILIDNIIASSPAMGITIEPYGVAADNGNRLLKGWRYAPFDIPFPIAGDKVHARVKVNYVVNGTNEVDSSFASLVTMWGRWRYLNQDVGEWTEYRLFPSGTDESCFMSNEMLPLDKAGDFEFYFKAVANAPYYCYHDYSGLSGWSWPDGFTESRSNMEISATKDGIYSDDFISPTFGKNYFIRLRDGVSDLEKVEVVLGGALNKIITLENIGTHTWRGFLVSTNAIGDVSFYFRERNRQVAGSTVYYDNVLERYPLGDATLPSTGDTELDGLPRYFTTDGASNYIEFRYSDDTGSFTIGHAEYQNFNAWHDANLGDEIFVGSYAETSGVDMVSMIMTNAHMNTWLLPTTADENWNESFYLTNYEDENYPKNIPYITHAMPHLWEGENGQFTDAKLVANTGAAKTNDAGIAWQMRGSTFGNISFMQNAGPAGIDTVSFQAHLAQGIEFNDFSVWNGDGSNSATNYIFMIPALMSSRVGTDMAPGAAMSVVGYYRQHQGCYEFRVERAGNNGLQFSIYKWREENYAISPELIATKWFSGATFQLPSTTSTGKPDMFGMFISIGVDPENRGATTIIGGLTVNASNPLAGYSGVQYRAISAIDNSPTRFTKGSFGVLTKNCNGRFLTPQHYEGVFKMFDIGNNLRSEYDSEHPMYAGYVDNASNGGTLTISGTQRSDQDKFDTDWDFVPGRIEVCTNKLYASYPILGLQAKTGLKQSVGIYTKKRSDADAQWVCVTNVSVSGYGFSTYKIPVMTTYDSYLRLRTGEAPTDVTIWDVKQTSWRGEDISNINGLSRDFVYTQGWVVEEKVDGITSHYLKMQPKRALPTKPLSIRSPILSGVGMIGFSYRDVQPGCEILVQVATNQVSANMNVYNQSIVEGADIGEWTTLKAITYEELAEMDSRSIYIGIHDRNDAPVRGIVRICASPECVTMAESSSLANYGAITITDIWVHDEPALDTKCWRGWNIRTTGDAVDSEQRMYLNDGKLVQRDGSSAFGMSGALNNSLADGVTAELTEINTDNPYIQSPTFGNYTNAMGIVTKAGIGMVRFRARLYDRYAGVSPAHVSIFGIQDGADEDWGEALTNIVVDTLDFKQYEFKVLGRKKYAAMRISIDGVINPGDVNFVAQRVVFDDIAVSEKADATIGFEYARPFRTGVNSDIVINDILEREQQPLCGESWGIQTKLKMQRIGNEVDTNRGFRVTFRYYVGKRPWGFVNWRDLEDASQEVDLVQVGKPDDYIFRSTVLNPDTIVPPEDAPNTVIQYMVTVYYYMNGDDELFDQNIEWGSAEGTGWTNPSWYAPVDYNEDYAMLTGEYSPYTILDTVSPGRAWINEVNYNDGPKRQNDGTAPTTNQFIEIAIPAGVDMSGWMVKVTDMDYNQFTIATLGKNGIPAYKMSGNVSGDYDFLVLQSPATKSAGGIHDIDGNMAADGTWTSDSMSSDFKSGTFRYGQPYEIGLYRPSGVMEHQFVIQGTNEYVTSSYGYQYEGTNLVAELNVLQSEMTRFFAGQDLARRADGTTFASLGVVGFAHGEEGGWKEGMTFTPGRLNEDQEELSDWFLHANGTNIWVYAKVVGPHISQTIGLETGRDTFVIVPAGGSTNISYTIDNWYQLDSLTVNGVTNSEAIGRKGFYMLEITNITETVKVVATEGISSEIIDAGLDPNDAYTPAVMNWLETGVADGKPFANPAGPIKLAKYKGLQASDPVTNLSLRAMYWFDIDPTLDGWWLRGGVSKFDGTKIGRKRQLNAEQTVYYTNYLVQVKMYFSNEVDTTITPFAPKRLQGLAGEKSDAIDLEQQAWTSVNFKVTAMIDNKQEHNLGFMPFRWFVFDSNSFYSATEATSAHPAYTADIEVLDPFSVTSPGYSYGWYGWGSLADWVLFSWNIGPGTQMSTVETLNKNSTYDHLPYQPWNFVDP